MAQPSTRFHLGATSILPVYLDEPKDASTLNAILDHRPTSSSSSDQTRNALGELDLQIFPAIGAGLAFLPSLAKLIDGPSAEESGVLRPLAQRMAREVSDRSADALKSQNDQTVSSEIARITENTVQALRLDVNASEDEIIAACTGEKQRWESIGIVIAMMGISVMLSSESRTTSMAASLDHVDRDILVKTVVEASNACATLLDTLGAINELVAWHHLENAALCRMYYGEFHRLTSRRQGRLSSSVVENGLDDVADEAAGEPSVLMLDRVRCEIGVRSQSLDQQLSISTGRPPMLRTPARQDQWPPGAAHLPALTPSFSGSTELGSSAWRSWQGAVASIQQEILHLLLSCQEYEQAERSGLVHALDEKIETVWKCLPEPCRAKHDHWNVKRPLEYNCQTVVLHLDILMLRFLLCRFRSQLGESCEGATVAVSEDIIDAVLSFTLQRGRLRNVMVNYSHIVSFYGLPAARVLAHSLRSGAQNSQRSFDIIMHADIVKRLSAFLRCLQWAMPHREGDFRNCCRSKRLIQEALDGVLSSPSSSAEFERGKHPNTLADIADLSIWQTAASWQDDWSVEAESRCRDQTFGHGE